MSRTPDNPSADPQQIIVVLQRQLATHTVERDQARTERDQSEAQRAALAEVLGIINEAPGDLKSAFESVLDKATTLCEAAFGILWVYQNDRFYPVALNRVPAPFAEFLGEHQDEGSYAGTAVQSAMPWP